MKVVVVGAGYAGTMAANRLAKRAKSTEITVLNQRPEFVERVRLHQQVAGTGRVAAPLGSVLRDGIDWRVGTVDKVGDGSVVLTDGQVIGFDYAVLAVGSTVAPLPGTVPVGVWEGAEQARRELSALQEGSIVTVVGGGATGVETAAEVAESRPDLRVRLIGATVAGSFTHTAHTRIRDLLGQLGVEIVVDTVAEVDASASGTVVHLGSGRVLTSDLTLWAIIGSTPDLAARSGLRVDPSGRAVVDDYLRSVDDERVFAIGDCAAVPGARQSCYTASPQGMYAANALARLSKGRDPRPFTLGPYTGRAVTLGRHAAILQFTRTDDTLRKAHLGGRSAAVLKELASRTAKFGATTGL